MKSKSAQKIKLISFDSLLGIQISELQNLRKYHPQLWKHLLEMDQQAREQFGGSPLGQFKQSWSAEGLEKRFAQEEKAKLILP